MTTGQSGPRVARTGQILYAGMLSVHPVPVPFRKDLFRKRHGPDGSPKPTLIYCRKIDRAKVACMESRRHKGPQTLNPIQQRSLLIISSRSSNSDQPALLLVASEKLVIHEEGNDARKPHRLLVWKRQGVGCCRPIFTLLVLLLGL